MPFGCLAAIGPSINLAINEAQHQVGWGKPFSILDLGCGYGVMGAVVKCHYAQCKVYGVEGIETFRAIHGRPVGSSGIWDAAYEHVAIADVRDHVPKLIENGHKHTVGFFFELLEHLPKADGAELMRLLPQVADSWLMSTPDSWFGTPPGQYQDHVSVWTKEELREHGWRILQPKPEPTSWRVLGFPMLLAYMGPWSVENSLGLWVDETPSDEGLVLEVPEEE